ncbi:Cytochrome P450 monooxygenase COX2 [Psilocybe cubensis]|uniref:Cytochrome P450 monooxygenase COX2 n=2 Tax=Psilocybe cubensis TaxID=181762 RepID=A0ACB8H563_PSICU|nr:Cytochrome P450 monooxygenase COX2 [Psilocybe cubensis]KAH9483138.1 Cytochrome P450 monooxygenase COX2 [Psilocybe cubensis]
MSGLLSKASAIFITYPVYTFVLGTLVYALVVKILLGKSRYLKRNPRNLPLPPGPKGYPIIGNLFDVPKDKPWVGYSEWTKTYGDMIYFEVLGQPFIVLNSLQRTIDLFDKRSSNYSDRMRMPMVLELMDWDYNMAMLPYGQWWRRHRRAFTEHFHHNIVWKYQPTQLRETRAFLHRLLTTPENFMHHIRHTFAATIMSVAYGITIKDTEDPYISNAEEALMGLAEAGIPGSFLVDLMPWLKYIPAWFPGAGFQRKAAHWRKVNADVAQKPFKFAEEELQKGTAVPSLSSTLIERLPDKSDPYYAEERKIAQDTAAVAYVGGADTTVSTVQSFFLAMALYPDVQKRAQAELDAVVGRGRLPEFSDRDAMPYVNALVKESVRWNQVIPLAVGHMATEDDEYDGYFIPRGTVVMGNGWAILHDPEVFEDPMEFRPERYLKDGQLDPDARNPDCAAFGYGRRKCPGRHMSDNALYSIVASVLSVYDITPPRDESGKMVQLKAEFTSGLLSYPAPFECVIKPRSPEAEALIRDCVE